MTRTDLILSHDRVTAPLRPRGVVQYCRCTCCSPMDPITVHEESTSTLNPSSPSATETRVPNLSLSFVNFRPKSHQVQRDTHANRTLLSVPSRVVHRNIPLFVLHVVCNYHDGGNAALRPAEGPGARGRILPHFCLCSVYERSFNSCAVLFAYRGGPSGVPVFIANMFMVQGIYKNVRQV